MNEAILKEILNEVKSMGGRLDRIDARLDGMDARLAGMDSRFDGMDTRLTSLESELKQFREETRADLQILKGGQKGIRSEIYDRFTETKNELNAQQYSIDILHREQLKMKTDIEMLKNR
ncbi:hypothetical protein [Paenibacillus oceani]|uniref:t-SNARE coiled-coil homology domain-containing protein n=1 Tax=Paenibacillus oceani TaxID=2772510 RepID=A0A927CBV1_9BACL|nr:hypothetical protein [Paenibacillus oceani]MBD2864795.1 hypothetical protein [Paenibacillus oceani]